MMWSAERTQQIYISAGLAHFLQTCPGEGRDIGKIEFTISECYKYYTILKRQLGCCSFAVVTMLLLLSCCYIAAAVVLLLYCCFSDAGVLLLPKLGHAARWVGAVIIRALSSAASCTRHTGAKQNCFQKKTKKLLNILLLRQIRAEDFNSGTFN